MKSQVTTPRSNQVRNHKRPTFGPVVANMLPRLSRQCSAITEMISKGCTWPPSLARHSLPVLARNRHMLMAHYRNDIWGLHLCTRIWRLDLVNCSLPIARNKCVMQLLILKTRRIGLFTYFKLTCMV